MEIGTALEIKKALILLEEELGITPLGMASLIRLTSESGYRKLLEASRLWNEIDVSNMSHIVTNEMMDLISILGIDNTDI